MTILTGAYRLFFPFAGLFAALGIPLWLVLYMGATDLMDDPLSWHQHELLFGYLSAALAGFLFTAIPNWTGRPALAPHGVASLFALWALARVAGLIAPDTLTTSLIALAFLPIVAGIALREVLAAGNKRNLVIVAMVMALSIAQACFLFGDADLGLNAGFSVAFMMMVLIGGRVTPAFTRNWLKKKGDEKLPPQFGTIDKVAMLASVLAALSWTATGETQATGILAAISAVALTLRLSRWRGFAVVREPLLFAQHAAYLWLPISMALLALATLTDLATLSHARHALGAGAVGTMTVIVMLRALLGHSGRPIIGTKIDWVLLNALHLGAVIRITADWVDDPMPMIHGGGTLWALGMLIFTIRAFPIAIAPRL